MLTTHNDESRYGESCIAGKTCRKSSTFAAKVEGDYPESLYPIDLNLELKTGAQVMFIRNDNSGKQEFYNGKIGSVVSMKNDSIEVRLRRNHRSETLRSKHSATQQMHTMVK
jgi:hypothetical protein